MNSKCIVRVYGDSLSLPRPEDDVEAGDTYADLFRSFLITQINKEETYLYNRGYGGATVKDLYRIFNQDSLFANKKEKSLIIQCGIVDCAPRPIPSILRLIIGFTPNIIRKFIVSILHKCRPYLLSRGIFWRYVPKNEFRKVLSVWLSEASIRFENVIVVNIAPTLESTEVHSPGLSASIIEYNTIINECIANSSFKNIDLVDFYGAAVASNKNILLKDGIHISKDGHRLCADLIINKYINANQILKHID